MSLPRKKTRKKSKRNKNARREKSRKEQKRETALRRGKYISQWTPDERRAGLGQMVGLAADARANRYMKRKGKAYELIEMYDVKGLAYDDARDWRSHSPKSKVILKPFGKDFLWGLYVNSSANKTKRTVHVTSRTGLHQFDYKEVSRVDSIMKYDYDKIKHLASWGYRFGEPTLVEMSPAHFLKFAPLTPQVTSEKSMVSIRKGLKEGAVFETPFIDLNEKGIVVSHEGRHRAMVLKEMGEDKMPVIIYDRKLRDYDYRDYESSAVKKAVKEYRERKRQLRQGGKSNEPQ